MKKKAFIKISVFILVSYGVNICTIIYSKHVQVLIGWLISKPYMKSFLNLTIPILVSVLTIISTWMIFLWSEEEKEKEKEKREKELYEEKCNEVRPWFYMVENNKKIEFVSLTAKKIILKNVNVFYINKNNEVTQTYFKGTLTLQENDKSQFDLDEIKLLTHLYIIVKAETIMKEHIAYVYKTDDNTESNLIADREYPTVWKDIYGKEIYAHIKIMKVVDEYIDKFSFGGKDVFKENIKFTILCIGEGNIYQLSQYIALIRRYAPSFSSEDIEIILSNIANCLRNSKLKITNNYNQNYYFEKNMIGTNTFSVTYRKFFQKAGEQNQTVLPTQMAEYICDYIQQYYNDLLRSNTFEQECALRNIEVYIRDTLSGSIYQKDGVNEIITILKNKLNCL